MSCKPRSALLQSCQLGCVAVTFVERVTSARLSGGGLRYQYSAASQRLRARRDHWPEYVMKAAGVALVLYLATLKEQVWDSGWSVNT